MKHITLLAGILLILLSFSPVQSTPITEETTVLLTGFGPFLNYTTNPSQEVALALHNTTIGTHHIISIILPVTFDGAIANMTDAITHYHPDYIISLGLQANIQSIHLETLGLNIKRTQNEDDTWTLPYRINTSDRLLYTSTLPTYQLTKAIREEGIPVRQSIYAGSYVCNSLLYQTLSHLHHTQQDIPMCFIHLPQEKTINSQGLPINEMTTAITIAINSLP